MKVIPAIVIAEPTAGVVFEEAPKIAVSPATSGTFAGVQLAALFQFPFAGAAFHVCAMLVSGRRTMPHRTAIEDASSRAGLAVMGWVAIFLAVTVLGVGHFILRYFLGTD